MYKANISKINNIIKHPNADRLNLASVNGFQFVVGTSMEAGSLCILFQTDGQLSHEYCVANDLYPRFDENGKKVGGGFFDPKSRRVRSQNFRGQKSEGYLAPLDSVKFTGVDMSILVEGFEFDELNGIPICNKYMTEATIREIQKRKQGDIVKITRKEIPTFKCHFDTHHFKKNAHTIKPGSIIYITEKLHGTSQRYGHVYDEAHPRPMKIWKRSINNKYRRTLGKWLYNLGLSKGEYVPFKETDKRWAHLIGSRNLILMQDPFGRYKEGYRYNAVKNLEGFIKKGEVFYMEIVGWTDNAKLIMQQVSTKELKDKLITDKYGDTMRYTYGCKTGECDIYVYRHVMTNEDGFAVESSWNETTNRCSQLGLKTTPIVVNPFIYDGNEDKLRELVDSVLEGPSLIDQSHIREGVIIRAEHHTGNVVLKAKSHTFNMLESIMKDRADVVDLEEIS